MKTDKKVMPVLVAVDGSKYGRWGVQWVARLPLARPPRVTALHVVDLSPLAGLAVPPLIEAYAAQLEKHARAIAEETTTLLSSLGVDGRAVVKHGQVAAIIVREAKRGYRLLVVGHRGMTGLARFVIGSVALHVVRSASCPVLVVKQVPRQVSRILVAVDGSDASDRIVRFLTTELSPAAASQAQSAEPAVEAVVHHVLPFMFKRDEAELAGREVVQHYGQKLAKAGYRVMEEVTFGGPAEELTAMAKRRKVNLIVAGAKGMGNVASFLLGSVATRLVERSHVSVLVVR